MKKKKMTTAIIGGITVLVLVFFSYMMIRNNLVSAHAQVEEQWANVDTKLQRRHDLIPNLVAVVKGQMAHETEVFTAIDKARSQVSVANTNSEKIQAETNLTTALGRLTTLIQTYPELRSSESVNKLMDELAGAENRISEENRKLNKIIKEYNIKVTSLPTSLFAGSLGYQPEEYFKADAAAKEVPKVDLESKK